MMNVVIKMVRVVGSWPLRVDQKWIGILKILVYNSSQLAQIQLDEFHIKFFDEIFNGHINHQTNENVNLPYQ